MDNKELLSMSDGLLIQLLQKNARYKVSDLAAALAESKDSIVERLNKLEKEKEIARLENLMREASEILDFEQAIVIRDKIRELKGK